MAAKKPGDPSTAERRMDEQVRAMATGVVNEMERRMGVNFVTHSADHSWIGTKRQAEAEADELRREESKERQRLHGEIKRTILLRIVIPGLGAAFLAALFGREIAVKLFGFILGHAG